MESQVKAIENHRGSELFADSAVVDTPTERPLKKANVQRLVNSLTNFVAPLGKQEGDRSHEDQQS